MARRKDDDFGDFDDLDDFDSGFDFDVSEPKDDRKASTKFVGGFTEEFIGRDGIRDGIKRTTYKALPDGYRNAFDALNSTKSDLENIYDKTARELGPTKNAVKKLGRAFAPMMDKILPKRMSERYQELVAKEQRYGSGGNPEDMAIAAVMSEVFGAQQEANKIQRDEDEVERQSEKEIEIARHKASESARVQSEQVALKFQMRILEVQYRHLFVSRENLTLNKSTSIDQINLLKEIQKNTALPNEAKLLGSEHLKRMVTEKLFGISTEGVGRKFSNMRSRIMKNLEKEAMGVAQLMNELSSGLEQLIMEDTEEGMPSTSEFLGSMGGSMARDWLADMAGEKIRGVLNKNKTIRRGASKLAAAQAGLPRYLNAMAARDQGAIGKFMRFALGGYSIGESKETVNHNLADIAGQPTPWDVISRRTLVEIIPHYQSLQLQVLERIAGQANPSRKVFSVTKERMVDFEDEVADTRERAFKTLDGGANREAVSLVNSIDSKNKLSPEAKIALATAIAKDSLAGKEYDPMRYYVGKQFGKHHNKIRKVLREHYGIKDKPEKKGGNAELNKVKTWLFGEDDRYKKELSSDEETNIRLEQDTIRFGRVGDYAGNLDKLIHLASGTGTKDILRAAGVIRSDRAGERDVLNYEYKDRLLEAAIAATVTGDNSEFKALIAERDADGVGSAQAIARGKKKLKQGRKKTASAKAYGYDGGGVGQPVPYRNLNTDTLEKLVSEGNVSNEALLTRIADRLDQGLLTGGVDEESASRLDKLIEALNANVQSGTFGSFAKRALGKLYRGGKGAILGSAKLANKTLGSAVNAGIWTGNTLGGIITGGYRKLTENYDIYLKGKTEPVIRAVLLKEGAYCDADGKVIKSYRQLIKAFKRGVYAVAEDGSRGELLVSVEDVKNGLIHAATKEGQGILGRLVNFGVGFFSNSFEMGGKVLDATVGLARLAKDTVIDKLTEPMDAYVGDDLKKPRLRKIIFINGGYFSKSTGRPLKHPGNIDGDVIDGDGNVIVSLEEITQYGLYDSHGRPIESGSLSAAIGRFIGRGINVGTSMVKWGLKTARGVFDAGIKGVRAVGGYLAGKIPGIGSTKSEDYLLQILTHMQTVWPTTEAHNALRDMIPESKRGKTLTDEETNEEQQNVQMEILAEVMEDVMSPEKRATMGGWWKKRFSGLKGRLSGVGKSIKEKWANRKWFKKGTAGAAGTAAAGGIIDRFRNRGKGGTEQTTPETKDGDSSLTGSAAGDAAAEIVGEKVAEKVEEMVTERVTEKVTEMVTEKKLLTRAAVWAGGALSLTTGMVTTAATWIAAGASLMLANPLTWGLVGGIAATYVGWKLYKAAQRRRKREPVETMRFLQYGIDVQDDDQVIAVRYLEEELESKISVTRDGKVKYLFTYDQVWDIATNAFDLDADSLEDADRFRQWFYKRFLIVFPMHMITAKIFGVPVRFVDTKLKHSLKADYVNNCRLDNAGKLVGHDPYEVLTSPWKNKTISSNKHLIRDIVNRIIEAAAKNEEAKEGGRVGAFGRFLDKLLGPSKPSENTYAADRAKEEARKKDEIKRKGAIADYKEKRGTGAAFGTKTGPGIGSGPTDSQKTNEVRDKLADKSNIPIMLRRAMPGYSHLIMPTVGKISSDFGSRTDPHSLAKADHKGVDISAPTGTPVYAAASGVVLRADYSNTYGNVVYIDHPDGTQTRYAHLSRIAPGIVVGGYVNQGDLLGQVGSTGKSTGPHLHFEYRDVLDPGSSKLTGWELENLRKPLNPLAMMQPGTAPKKVKSAPSDAQAKREESAYTSGTPAVKSPLPAPKQTAPVAAVPKPVANPNKVRDALVAATEIDFADPQSFNVTADVSSMEKPITAAARTAEQQRLELLEETRVTNSLLATVAENLSKLAPEQQKVATSSPAKPAPSVSVEPYKPVVDNSKKRYS